MPSRATSPITTLTAREQPLLDEPVAPASPPPPTVGSILLTSAPAILNNVAAPLAAALQLGLLGHSSGSHIWVAVFTAVNAVTAFVANIANFLIVVTMARVAHALGAQQWALLGKMVRAVLLTAIVVGCVSAGVLYLLRAPLLAALSLGHTTSNTTTTLSDDESVDAPTMAARYLPAALLRVPPLLLLRASTSVLVGYGKMRLASAINGSLAVVDTAAFFIALRLLDYDLRDIGLVIASTCGVAALVATIALLLLPPVPKKVRVCCTCDPGTSDDEPSSSSSNTSSSSLLSLACDSVNVLIRSLLLQGSLLALTLAAAPLGTTALSAHAVLLQLWMLTSYVVDGFADTGTMIGGRLLGGGHTRQMRRLTIILAALGLLTGLAVGGGLALLRKPLSIAFTKHEPTRILLTSGYLWPVLCILQPINSLVFVYDGLLYATRSFSFVRNALAIGVILIFAPSLGCVVVYEYTLVNLWIAKAGLNGWRCVSALFRIHCQLWPKWVGTRVAVQEEHAVCCAPLESGAGEGSPRSPRSPTLPPWWSIRTM